MTTMKTLRNGLAVVLILFSLTACGSPSSAGTPTPENSPTASVPTKTLVPTRTPIPTEVPPTQPASALTTTPAAGTTPAAAGTAAATKAAPAANAGGGTGPTDKYQFLGQTIADKIQVRPGTTMTITWTIKNAGTVGWTTDYSMRYFSGIKAAKDFYNFSRAVPAEKSIDLTVTIQAPNVNGDYNTWWKLTNAQGQNFGDVDFSFTVTNTPSNVKPTATKAQ